MQPEVLIQEAIRIGVQKFAITEINNTASYIELIRLAAGLNNQDNKNNLSQCIEIIPGIEFRESGKLYYIAIAKNENGFESINRFRSFHNETATPLPIRAPDLQNVFFIYPLGKFSAAQLKENEFIGIKPHEIIRLSLDEEKKLFPDKFLAWQPVTFSENSDFEVHRILRAIEQNTLLTKLSPETLARPDEKFFSLQNLKLKYQTCPELIEQAEQLLASCSFNFNLNENKNKATWTGDRTNDWAYLIQASTQGFKLKYPEPTDEVKERFERELRIIRQKNFCAYYLIALDLIRFAQQKGFVHVGRGSGANSMVAYCLGITNVDPVTLDLYFERFLNPERSSPPDFDLDFSWDQRNAIYDYLFSRYGKDYVCLLGTHTTLQEHSVIREIAKVYGLPKEEIDRLSESPNALRKKDQLTETILKYAVKMKDLPVNISIHAGGVLITEKPIYQYTATEFPPKGYPVSHFEMHNAEDAGIYKFDILSQRGLGHLKETVRLIEKNKGIKVNIDRFKDFSVDPEIRLRLKKGKTIGCFYVESPAMRMLLKKLRCEDYITLVAASSIIRPGVARSGMMRAYIERFHLAQKGKSYSVIHPEIGKLLSETFGVMVYQEDVIRVAHFFAGLTLAEADILRRGMSGKFRSRKEFERIQNKFFENCKGLGYQEEIINRVWYEIESFSGYSFSKGHSASYAVESYQSLYLKAHFPLEFMVGVINNFGGFYRTEFYFHEARLNGAQIEGPDVNNSQYLTDIQNQTIYTGFIHLKSLENKIAAIIPAERSQNGSYQNLKDFMERVPAGIEQLRILIRSGAFRFTGKSKQELLWEALIYFNQQKNTGAPGSLQLFERETVEMNLPALDRNPIEDLFDEIELLGFPLQDPFRILDGPSKTNYLAKDLPGQKGKKIQIIGYLITTKHTSTSTRQSMYFGTFMDAEGQTFDSVHFPVSAARFPFRGRGFYKIEGKVSEEFDVYTIETDRMEKLPIINKRDQIFREEPPEQIFNQHQ